MKNLFIYKRLMLLCFFFFISLSICGIINIAQRQNELITTSATPITNKVIVIDAGHGLPDAGAEGLFGTTEQAINLSIALKLQKIIEQSGAKVYLTRSDENGIYSLDSKTIRQKKISDSKNRVKIGNESGANIFVSIHLNKFPADGSYSGWQSFYKKDNADSSLLANFIQDNLNKNINIKNDRKPLPIKNVYVMDKLQIPAVIVECGFLSNEEETKNLKDEKYQNKLAWGIYLGIQNYFNEKGEGNATLHE